jgi:hypothetical protein
MEDIEVFVRGYTRDALPRIEYSGSIDPLEPRIPQDRDFLRQDDPNLPLRSAVISFLFGPPHAKHTAVADDLLHDLFVAHWKFAVSHDSVGHEALALEVLGRGLYGTFVNAYTLLLGMDQGCPLEAAISRIGASGKSPVPELILALESLLETETHPRALEHLKKWREWLKKQPR